MNKKHVVGLVVVVVVVLWFAFFYISYSPPLKPTQGQLSASLRLNWIYTGSFAGEVVGWKEIAPKIGLNLVVEQGGQGLDPLKLVGENEFGTAAADEILNANEKGSDFVIIGVINDDSPTAFVSLKKTGITKPSDFIGKRVGILPFGSTGLVYQAMLKRNGIDRKKINEVVVSPDLRPFIIAATNDVQPIFIYDETVTLENQGIDYNLIEPKKFGVSFKGPCYFTRRSTIQRNPKLVLAFVRSMAEGWDRAIQDPKSAIAVLKTVDKSINETRELQVLKKGLPYFSSADRQPLQSVSSWEQMLDDLVNFGVLAEKPHANKFLDLSFVRSYYSSPKK